MGIALAAGVYGAGRQYLNNAVAPLTSKIPLGQYADEALFGVGGYFLAKKGSGILKSLGLSMLIVESASVGHQLVGSNMANGSSNGITFHG